MSVISQQTARCSDLNLQTKKQNDAGIQDIAKDISGLIICIYEACKSDSNTRAVSQEFSQDIMELSRFVVCWFILASNEIIMWSVKLSKVSGRRLCYLSKEEVVIPVHLQSFVENSNRRCSTTSSGMYPEIRGV